MRTPHMKARIRYMLQGAVLETHDDIPDTIRDQLYAEEHRRIEKQQKVSNPLRRWGARNDSWNTEMSEGTGHGCFLRCGRNGRNAGITKETPRVVGSARSVKFDALLQRLRKTSATDAEVI
ncbi:hypothetical protein ACJ72_06660 [Emergomyces africanus]|uniref:Uncharacterized protein n=1 Tax=Emergomyces africanus TaxID=1955775 RepID=A0A1B7NQC3_9EURO|nr:hypothetical protein ACJ72_06660 [Emergomyces africanus]